MQGELRQATGGGTGERRQPHESGALAGGGGRQKVSAAVSPARAFLLFSFGSSRHIWHPGRTGKGVAAGPPGSGGQAVNRMVRQALSLGLAWVAAVAAESGPHCANSSARGACDAEWSGQARLAPLWMAAPAPAGAGAPRATLIQVLPSAEGIRFRPARFRGRVGWEAPGTSSSRFQSVKARSRSELSRARQREELTDLHARRARGGRGAAGRNAFSQWYPESPGMRAARPADASVLSVSSSLD